MNRYGNFYNIFTGTFIEISQVMVAALVLDLQQSTLEVAECGEAEQASLQLLRSGVVLVLMKG